MQPETPLVEFHAGLLKTVFVQQRPDGSLHIYNLSRDLETRSAQIELVERIVALMQQRETPS